MRIVGMFLALTLIALTTIQATAQIQVTVQGNQGPWNQSLNPGQPYGPNDNADPTVVSAASGIAFVPGGTITVAYASGTVSVCPGPPNNCPYTDANGWLADPTNQNYGPVCFYYPSNYMRPDPIYASELVGTFGYNASDATEPGTIVGLPFAIGDGPATFTIPVGANQLMLGVDDNCYNDNAGSWTLNISSSSTKLPKANGIQNAVTITSLDTSSLTACPDLSVDFCFSIQQNFYMSLASKPSVPVYWVQNLLVSSLGPAKADWYVAHVYEVWSTHPDGTVIKCIAGCGPTLGLGTLWWSASDMGNSPPLNLTSTISVSNGVATVNLEASLEEAAGKKALKSHSYAFPATPQIMAATTSEQARNFAFAGYQLEPELMIVGPAFKETVAFIPTTTGTVTAQFRYPRYSGNIWLPPATQYATQTLSNPNLTPNPAYSLRA